MKVKNEGEAEVADDAGAASTDPTMTTTTTDTTSGRVEVAAATTGPKEQGVGNIGPIPTPKGDSKLGEGLRNEKAASSSAASAALSAKDAKPQPPAWQRRSVAATRFYDEGDYNMALSCFISALSSLQQDTEEEEEEDDQDESAAVAYGKGQKVRYFDKSVQDWVDAVVVEVHEDDMEDDDDVDAVYYTVRCRDNDTSMMTMKEKQTTGESLRLGEKEEEERARKRKEAEAKREAAKKKRAAAPAMDMPSAIREKQKLLLKIVQCRLKLGGPANAEAALENVKQCIALDGDYDEGHYYLARAYLATSAAGNNNNLEASGALEKCLSINPDHVGAKRLLDKMWKASSSSSNKTNKKKKGGSAAATAEAPKKQTEAGVNKEKTATAGAAPAGTKTYKTWQASKEAAESYYKNEKYGKALEMYEAAACNSHDSCPRSVRQSFMISAVDCRLKLGGQPNVVAALSTAKQCVDLGRRYDRGHLALAKAYLALADINEGAGGGGDSMADAAAAQYGRKAFDALEMCLKCNPNNVEAQRLHVKQVRSLAQAKFRATGGGGGANNRDGRGGPGGGGGGRHYDGDAHVEPDDKMTIGRMFHDVLVATGLDGMYDDAVYFFNRQPRELQFLIKLIVLLGGLSLSLRLLSFISTHVFSSVNSAHHHGEAGWSSHQPRYLMDQNSYGGNAHGGASHWWNGLFDNLFGGGTTTSVLILFAVGYWCHKNGINPFIALFALNVVNGNRRHNNRDLMFAAGAYEMMRDEQDHRDDPWRGGRRRRPYHGGPWWWWWY